MTGHRVDNIKQHRSSVLRVLWRRVAAIALGFVLVTTAAVADEDNKAVVIAVKGEIGTLDPALAYNWENYFVTVVLNINLLRWDAIANEPGPDLASSMEVSEAGTLLRFKLRDDAYFHNGRQITSQDVLNSFNRIALPATESPFASFLTSVVGFDDVSSGAASTLSGVRAVGDFDLEIRLVQADASFAFVLAAPMTAIIPIEEITRPDFEQLPTGGGPYRIVENTATSLLLEHWPSYQMRNPHAAEQVTILKRYSANAAIRGVENGRVDFAALPDAAREVALLFENPRYKDLFKHLPMAATVFVAMNTERPPLNDVRVRQALNHAIDKQKLVNKHLKNTADVAEHMLPEVLQSSKQGAGPYAFDPDRARELLKEANYSSDTRLTMILLESDSNEATALDLINGFADIGVQVNPIPLPSTEFHRRAEQGEADLIFSDGAAWIADFIDASNFYFPLLSPRAIGSYNWPRFKNPAIEVEAKEINSMLGQDAERSRRWTELFARIHSDYAVWLPLYHRKVSVALSHPNLYHSKGAHLYSVEALDVRFASKK